MTPQHNVPRERVGGERDPGCSLGGSPGEIPLGDPRGTPADNFYAFSLVTLFLQGGDNFCYPPPGPTHPPRGGIT